MLPQLGHAGVPQGALGVLAVVNHDLIDGREDDEAGGAQCSCKQCRGQVLVDDGLHGLEAAVGRLHRGHAASAARDDDHAGGDERAHALDLDDAGRLGARHDAPPAAPWVFLHDPAQRSGLRLGLLGVVEAAHVLGGVLEVRVALGHQDGRADGARGPLERLGQRVLQHDADLSLGGSDGEVDGNGRKLVGRQVGAQQNLADLWPIAMGDHELGVAREGG
mmetsp:Transcript_23947/g.57206  ORF Transcript_23947/g.57206 Transcript_23947/m.57206 type:complete len:220 (-) Transcript_23947:117-776(-)